MAIISCPNCGHSVSNEALTCPNCKTSFDKQVNIQENKSSRESINKEIIVVKKYHALRIISTIFKVLAWINGITFGIIFLAGLAGSARGAMGDIPSLGGLAFIGSLGILILGALSVIITFAIAEIILVFIDIEENTRLSVLLKTREHLQRIS